ncbi:hypothetical protein EV356DRAFT_496218 [Viridothelium virens]|uniref:Uncharacterized protein n=1 Tax=Viridothelium virens TaxID=1048519 RepID=A0A6A6HH18_VIRVR|nr:hypothetical protein EV356DRAFT_496218 [Viridothelium virens]
MRLRQAAKHLSYGLRTHSGREFSNTAAKWETNPASATIPTDACDTEAELPVEFRDGKPRPVHKRRHGNSSLPLPPFMDPSIKAQKERHKTPKPLPGPKERTPFQQKLYENPYGTPFPSLHPSSSLTLR